MQNLKEAFGNNLRRIRKSKKLTLEKLSEAVDISPRQLTKIESGETFLTAETLSKISVALGISLKSLFDIDYADKYMYFHDGKFIKPQLKIIKDKKNVRVKSLYPLSVDSISINTSLTSNSLHSFLFNLVKELKTEIYAEVFFKKNRESIMKITQNNKFEYVFSKSDMVNSDAINSSLPIKDDNYYYINEKLRIFCKDKNKIEYVKTAIDALENKKSLDQLKIMIKGMELYER